MIDHATLKLISNFATRTHLNRDLSYSNSADGQGQGPNVFVGNYDYDNGSMASFKEEDDDRILDHNSAAAVDSN